MPSNTQKSKVLVIGANGYLGTAIGRTFVRAGWQTYGLVRNPEAAQALSLEEIIPIVRDLKDPSVDKILSSEAGYFDVAVVTVEDLANYTGFVESIIDLLRSLAQANAANGSKLFVLFSSGTKDWGQTGLANAPGLKPLDEESPRQPPAFLKERSEVSCRIFDQGDAFDAALVTPVNLYGLSASSTGYFFRMAEKAQKSGSVLQLRAHPKTILQFIHVDDCAQAYLALVDPKNAYLALADPKNRKNVEGRFIAVAGSHYETLEEIAEALVIDYQLPDDVQYLTEDGVKTALLDFVVFGFSQWFSGKRIQEITGWTTKRSEFSKDIHTYRKAFEAADTQGHPVVEKFDTIIGHF
ncbi:hypothetical protein N7481_013364 [Penicillium waksmanii]|uniref:uncharacterized protein n=1 Tax=Penicillium waksmanii TaxID=69791 RepID=UPI00254668FC|nr:uncharacterized protein N7481_013364 [Penicillium waksmanii]KAJ5963059.1 hypothetical protein N7481_013364 [Penicillium waksmanii]